MIRALRWAPPIVAVPAVLLAGAGPAGAAGRAAQATTTLAVTNHLISGTETSVSCLTLTRCVAVGSGSRGAQVVSLDNGRPTQVSVLPYHAPLLSVSCPNKTGCWALGQLPGTGGDRHVPVGVLLVKIGAAGQVTKVIHVAVPTGDALFQISCRTMTACQILGQNTAAVPGPLIFFSPWNGSRWRLDSFAVGDGGSSVSDFSCWQTTCVLAGFEQFNSSTGEAFAWTFHNGVSGPMNDKGLKTTFNALSCVSASTCYSIGSSHGAGVAVTISGGVPSAANEPMPLTAGSIGCIRATCWASGGNQIVTMRDGVVSGAPLTDTASTGFSEVIDNGNGYIAIGPATKRGETDVAIS
jgi:hypothetical protein